MIKTQSTTVNGSDVNSPFGGAISRRSLFAVSLLVIATASGCSKGGNAKLSGTDLGKTPAPDFTLTDHRGETVQMSALTGKAVVLTFIFTNCPDICPVTTSNMRATYEKLSPDARKNVAFLAITVDPERDTAEVLTRFSETFGFGDISAWHALLGSREQLEPVWAAYGIDPGAVTAEVESHVSGSGRPLERSHTDAVYLIDPQGRERSFMGSDFDPDGLARDIGSLI